MFEANMERRRRKQRGAEERAKKFGDKKGAGEARLKDKIKYQEELAEAARAESEKLKQEAEKARRKSELQYKLETMQREYDAYVSEQIRVWGGLRERSKEIEMEEQMKKWKDE